MFDLNEKIALVIGAASGIGEATARVLARAGAFVYLADLDEANGARVALEIGSEKAVFIKLNVAESAECEFRPEFHGSLPIKNRRFQLASNL